MNSIQFSAIWLVLTSLSSSVLGGVEAVLTCKDVTWDEVTGLGEMTIGWESSGEQLAGFQFNISSCQVKSISAVACDVDWS